MRGHLILIMKRLGKQLIVLTSSMYTVMSGGVNKGAKKMTTPRLGSARLIVSISDKEGFVIQHGTDGAVLASKRPEDCDKEWDALWRLFGELGVERANGR